MNCEELRECVAPFLDGELDPVQLQAAGEHIEGCADCAALVEKLAAVPLRPVAARPPTEPEFWEAMDRALAAEAGREPGYRERLRAWLGTELRVSRGAVVFYMLLLGLAFGWHLLSPGPSPLAPSMAGVERGAEPAPAPVSSPPAPRQKIEKASYAPVQQTF